MKQRAYYNENNGYAAQWLRNLIDAGLIADGYVDERSIADVRPGDLDGFTQCHFFAGIGGWSLALRRAGWPDHRPVWTGSCPCQPFSVAGKRKGFDDERHLWPQFKRLIEKRLPAVVFGEQVAGASHWLGGVRSDLDPMGYAVGAMPIEAASADADHFRDRYWFVADYDFQCAGQEREQRSRELGGTGCYPQAHPGPMADSDRVGSQVPLGERDDPSAKFPASPRDSLRDVVDAASIGWGEGWTEDEFRSRGFTAAVASIDGCQFIECPDGKWRRLPPPRVRWLGTRISSRVDKLRAIGNAIDWRPAAQFIAAYLEARS